MTYLPTDEEMKMMKEVDKYIVMDKDGNCYLPEDAPDEIKKMKKHIERMFDI